MRELRHHLGLLLKRLGPCPPAAARGAAAGRPSGREPLNLPKLSKIEDLSSPKETLYTALKVAADVRRRSPLDLSQAVQRVAELAEDWSPLVALPAFQRLMEDTRIGLARLNPAPA